MPRRRRPPVQAPMPRREWYGRVGDHSRVRVSIVIPARDAEAMIGRTVAAAGAQELDGGFQLGGVDDGTRDATAAAARDAGARVVSNATALGPAGARNAGVAAASEPLIAFT